MGAPSSQPGCSRPCAEVFWKEIHRGLGPPQTSRAPTHVHAPGPGICSQRPPQGALAFLYSLSPSPETNDKQTKQSGASCVWLLSSGLVGLPLSMRFYVDKGDIRSWNVCIWVCVCVGCVGAFACPVPVPRCMHLLQEDTSRGKPPWSEKECSSIVGIFTHSLIPLSPGTHTYRGRGIVQQMGRGKRAHQG